MKCSCCNWRTAETQGSLPGVLRTGTWSTLRPPRRSSSRLERTLVRPWYWPTSRKLSEEGKTQAPLPWVFYHFTLPFTHNTSLLTLLVTCVRDFPPPNYSLQHELGVPPINSLLTLHLLQRPVPSLGCRLCSWLMGSQSEFPRAPSSGLINLLEQLRELRETLTYIHQFIKWYRWTDA